MSSRQQHQQRTSSCNHQSVTNRLACIVHRFLTVQTQVKTFHWQTMSYSRHKSTDQLFSEMLELVDQFVETYMGMNKGQRLDFRKPNDGKTIRLTNITERGIVQILRQFAIFLGKMEDGLTKDLLNIRDELMGVVHQTLYLLTLK